MNYLLDTTQTIPPGVGFPLYGTTHLLWLAFALVFILGVSLAYHHCSKRGRANLRLLMGMLLVADEIFKYIFLIAGDRWLADYLPLHLCSVNIFLIAFHAVRPSKLLDNFFYTVCIPGAMAALLFPSWASLPFPNLMHIHSFTVHTLLVAYPVMLWLNGDIRPSPRYIPHCVGLLLLVTIPGLVVNLIWDSNFMFLNYAEPGNPLYWFEVQFGNHLIGLPVLMGAVAVVMHLPLWLWHRHKYRQPSVF